MFIVQEYAMNHDRAELGGLDVSIATFRTSHKQLFSEIKQHKWIGTKAKLKLPIREKLTHQRE